jgi:outer membrane protein
MKAAGWRALLLAGVLDITVPGLRSAMAQSPAPPAANLSLREAKLYALRNNPRIRAADWNTEAAQSVVREVGSARLPTVSGLATGVEAQHSSILAAGALQTSSLYSRVSSGIAVSQLVTDFGRTAGLTQSAELRRQAQAGSASAMRQAVLLQVDQAYFQALGGIAALGAAQAAVNSSEVRLRQIRALSESAMRSTLDVRFAEVALSQTQLEVYQAENMAAAAQSNLAAALGLDHTEPFSLADEAMPAALEATPDARVQEGLRNRPELRVLTLLRDAARSFAQAEGRLKMPTVSVLGAAGVVPAGDPRLPNTYSAAGVNVTIPILNGGLFAARRSEAEQRAAAAESDVRTMSVQIAREVRVAWLEANTAARRMDVTARLVTEAIEALRLAQTRYDAGLGSIVELSQAQLNQTSAQIQNATARYEYLSRRAALDYSTGDLQ